MLSCKCPGAEQRAGMLAEDRPGMLMLLLLPLMLLVLASVATAASIAAGGGCAAGLKNLVAMRVFTGEALHPSSEGVGEAS